MNIEEAKLLLHNYEREAKEQYEKHHYKKVEDKYTDLIAQLTACEDTLEGKKTLALAYNNRGHSKYMQVSFDEAIEDYSTSLELDPSLSIAYYNRATVTYRLIQSNDISVKLKSLKEALEDFTRAAELQPANSEFSEGLKHCKDLYKKMEGDGNTTSSKKKLAVSLLKWEKISKANLIKLLFLLDNGDKSTGKKESHTEQNAKHATEALQAIYSCLKGDNDPSDIETVLKRRAKELHEYPIINLPNDTQAAMYAVRVNDEGLLTFVGACETLGIECEKFHNKRKDVQEKLQLDANERKGNFFIYAENLRMVLICEQLTPDLVHTFFEIVKYEKDVIEPKFEVTLTKLEKVEGLKEALFFYIIRLLEIKGKLNRIYTSKLEDLLDILKRRTTDKADVLTIENIIDELSTYPMSCQPVGHCLAFCVTDQRNGAHEEMKKVKDVFQNSLGFTVKVEENPTEEMLENCVKELKKDKYRFYDSLVVWFMSHGTGSKIQLSDGQMLERKEFIDRFCKLDNFRKKPKIFFMTSCQGTNVISVGSQCGVRVALDGAVPATTEAEKFVNIPDKYKNLTAVYYEMDRIVAFATLPEKFAFRCKENGSVYVDTVCSLMEKHRGDNITQVLEKASNKMHQILFESAGDDFVGEAKQASYYESTLQKTFIVPKKKSE